MSGLPIDFALAWKSLPVMFDGLLTTVFLTVSVLIIGAVVSVPLALARMSKKRIFSWPAAIFVMFFRGSPLLILLYLVYYGFGQISAIRDGPLWVVFGDAYACAIIGLSLNHIAFLVDVVRGSLRAVPSGLVEASAALGNSPRDTFRYIQMPLAVRYGLKAYQNEVIMFTKGTAVVSVITVVDLTAVANELFEMTYDPFTPMLTAGFFYWVLINVMRFGFRRLETYLNRHQATEPPRHEAASLAETRPLPEATLGPRPMPTSSEETASVRETRRVAL
ncbi:ABC transporter permease [Acuticoccus mangrovi]|uniref:ABC transporter permease subunit n=1 Tax=Acuticoccus mangrovi TaxID=2796142 RepID=A0A934IMD9_9HYPH|nr:ABC transporter permease subunit [Acuticoccus mangrovi]MBJ3774069.1 ABC transporter permease subunit [Acuticoccus mangrovi]